MGNVAPIEAIPSHVLDGRSDVDVLIGNVVDVVGSVVVGAAADDDVAVDTVDDGVPWSPMHIPRR